MDDDATHLAASRRASIKSQNTNASINAAAVQNARPPLRERSSLRLRPPAVIQNAEPPSPCASSPHSDRLRRPSRMSLFTLFKSPKVERQHGYVEAGLSPVFAKEMHAPLSPLVVQVTSAATSRPGSVASAKAASMKTSRAGPFPTTPSPPAKLRKVGPFEHPPLFQAYPQAMKQGVLEISSIPIDVLNRARIHMNRPAAISPDKLPEEWTSLEAKRTSSSRPSPNATFGTPELSRKIFVLVTSGYLLQYAETGPSDRLPEMVLSLGKDSAAFASDAVAGKHYVLQVSQAVDRDGIIISNSASIFSRLGMRSAAAKRMTSNFVLVLPNAMEMSSWMAAIRQEIDVLRGNTRRGGTTRSLAPNGSLSASALDRTPSHRYQVKRHPSKVTPASSPSPHKSAPIRPDRADFVTVNVFELEANELDTDSSESGSDKRSSGETAVPTYVDSVSKFNSEIPAADDGPMLVDRQSTLPFRQSQDPLPPPSMSSRPSMLQAESDRSLEDDDPDYSLHLARPSSSSQNFSRKEPPAPLKLSVQSLPPANRGPVVQPPSLADQPIRRSSELQRSFQEIRNTQVPARDTSKRDSKIAGLPSTPETDLHDTEKADEVRMLPTAAALAASRHIVSMAPELGRIPVTSVRSTNSRRIGSFSVPLKINPAGTSAVLPSGNPRRHSRMDEPDRGEHLPVGMAIAPPAQFSKPEPVSSSGSTASSSMPPSEGKDKPPPISPPARLALFPSPSSISTTSSVERLQRTSSITSRQSYSPPASAPGTLKRPSSVQVRSNYAPFLSSIRASTGYGDGAGIRTAAPIRTMKPSRPPSIIDLHPQRQSSIEALKALKFDTPITEEDVNTAASPSGQPRCDKPQASLPPPPTTEPPPVEPSVTADPPLPPPDAPSSEPLPTDLPPLPPASRAATRSHVRKSKHKSPLPNLDFGMPVIGLGPPAPPPQMPLPAPPTLSRAASPTAMDEHPSNMERVAGLGISVS